MSGTERSYVPVEYFVECETPDHLKTKYYEVYVKRNNVEDYVSKKSSFKDRVRVKNEKTGNFVYFEIPKDINRTYQYFIGTDTLNQSIRTDCYGWCSQSLNPNSRMPPMALMIID